METLQYEVTDRNGARMCIRAALYDGNVIYVLATDVRGLILQEVDLPFPEMA